MTITWFTENYPPNKGGMSRSCDRIITNLRKHHTIHIYHFTNKCNAFSTKTHENGSYTAVPVFEDSSHTLNMLWAFIKDKIHVKNSDLYVGFGSHLNIKGITLISKWLQKPIVICFRGNDFDTAIFSQKKQDLLYSIENASAIACVTKEKVNRIKSMHLNPHVFFTPNAIHFENWQILKADITLSNRYKTELQLTKTTKVIGLVGFLKQKKGIDFFINSLRKSQLLNTVHLHIVGELELHIEDMLQLYDISYSKVIPESKSELIAHYLVCDAVAIPSIYDGMPNVIFEAAALNIPVIASRAGGIPDILNQHNAFLFDVLSETSLLQALSAFDQADNENLESKIKQLKLTLQNEFSTSHETQHYLDIFNHITSTNL
ncbi:glycosyltransferase family 4 protein [Psychroserpens damuponensis]|uniref:glycosyltransferase family 4 protein n=1 Tax=Psychroserpens damuponensis TaxID=943936 RepID=UPI00058CB855|nr:glycosyltransferase family 4 protein [Psychroserpens damuponensis]